MKNERGSIEAVGIATVLGLALIGGGAFAFSWYGTKHEQTCTVTEKQATAQKDGGTNYIIFTKECGQLQIADDMILGNYNSTDVYASIHEGGSYYFKTVGWRNGFFSAYPNIDGVSQ